MNAPVDADATWRRFSEELRRWLRRRLPGASEAELEDLRQDILERAVSRQGSLREEQAIGAWLMTIARRRVIDHLRRARPEISEFDPELNAAPKSPATEELSDRVPGQVLGKWLELRLASLEPKYKEALELVEVQGLSQREAAERLGLKPSTMRSRVQRGRDRLMADLSACCRVELDGRNRVIDFERRSSPDPCACGDEDC